MIRSTRLLAFALLLGCNPQDLAAAPACPAPDGLAYVAPKPLNVMLVVDRSGSMDEVGACTGGSCPSKWEQLMALGDYVGEVSGASRTGLTIFPGPDVASDSCSVTDGIVVPLSDASGTGDEILGELASVQPGGNTPIADTLDMLSESGELDDPSRDNVVILLTDGQPNCHCNGDAACQRKAVRAVERLVGGEVPVELYVIGFGASAHVASQTLHAMGDAARATTDGQNFYQADNVDELVARFETVISELSSCDYPLADPPPAQDLQVWVNGQQVSPCTSSDCAEGYAYDPNTGVVQLARATCRAVANQECPDVQFYANGQ